MWTDVRTYFTDRLSKKLFMGMWWPLPPHLSCVATLPCEIRKFQNNTCKNAIEIGTNYNFHDFQGSTETHLKIDEKSCNTYRKISLKI